MRVQGFARVHTPDQTLKRVQDAIDAAIRPLAGCVTARTSMVTATLKAGQDNYVDHGLGVEPTGWTVARKSAPAEVYDSGTANPRPSLQLILRCTADVTVSLAVF